MSLWTSSVITLLLLQIAPSQPLQANDESKPVEEVAGPAEHLPRPVVLVKKDWNVNQAYLDVFKILSNQNSCSSFYGGPRAATTVLNDFVTLVKTDRLLGEVSFQMGGKRQFVRNTNVGVFYRLFDRTLVNSNGSFYQRRTDPMHKFPSDVGSFASGSRPARALILLHELGHLIQGENGDWLIPDDGFDGAQSKANTFRVQQACRAQLEQLK